MPLSKCEHVLVLPWQSMSTSGLGVCDSLWHVKQHQAKGMLSRSQTSNKKTQLNMQAKPGPEWQQELWRGVRRSPTANQEGVFRVKHLGFLSPWSFEKLYEVSLLCVRDATTLKKISFWKKKAKHQCWQRVTRVLREHDLLSWWEHFDCYEAFLTPCLGHEQVFLWLCFLFERAVMWKMSNLLCPAVSHCAELHFQHLLVYGDHLAPSAETTSHAFTERGQGFIG